MMFTGPLFMATAMPMSFRFLCTVVLTAASAGAVGGAVASSVIPILFFESWISIALVVLREFLVGVALGLFSALPLIAMQIAGEQIGMAMGLSMASAIDPMTQAQTPLVAQFQLTVGLWFYFRWNGHLMLVQAIVESLRVIPLAGLSIAPASDMSIGAWLSTVMDMATRMTLPFYCSLLLADVGLGFLARTVPQMNIFILGLPMKMALGFFVLMIALPLTVELIFDTLGPWVEFAIASAAALR
jgi:flagellar biosynthetic protein FliR